MGTQLPYKKGTAHYPIFGLLWQNGWMDQDATWYRGNRRCVRWWRSSPLKRAQSLSFRRMSIVGKRLDG